MGASFDAVTEAEAVGAIVGASGGERGCWVITANLDHLRRYRQEVVARRMFEEADLVVADGMPIVWASRLLGASLPERIAGSNMISSISAVAGTANRSIFLLGGMPGVAERAAAALMDSTPGLRVAGTLCPRFGFERDPIALKQIRAALVAAEPAIVFVALGFPKQDLLIRRLRPALPSASFVGVGISLSFIAGEIPRAPMWVRRSGLEWAHRLTQEPRRLARRYLLHGLPFALRLLTGATVHRALDDYHWGWDATA
jgi:N-acetylglucosaminyldiphosphoundecaprenol N-acetyl-beta-D-mannosaminyltransferase